MPTASKPSEARSPLVASERTALALAGVQLVLHVASALSARDPRIVLPHLVAWLQDLGLFALPVVLAAAVTRRAGQKWRARVGAVCRAVLLVLGGLLATYPRMLQSSLAFPVNLLHADLGASALFVRDYLGLQALWPAGVALAVGLVAPRFKFLRLPGKKVLVPALFVLVLASSARQAPNPVVYTLQDEFVEKLNPAQREVPKLLPGVAKQAAPAPASPLSADQPAQYEHVLWLVLEGVTSAEFEAEFLARAGGFAERNASHARYFRGYHAANLDSYTALIAMTTSVTVPFRSYADPERYERVNTLPNAPRAFRGKGFRTLFVSTYEHQPFVPNRADWDRIADRRDLPSLEGFTSLGTNRMESATEDRAALPLILAHLASAPRTFVLAELVYGHSPEWRATTGVTPLAYYDRYLVELLDALAQAGLAKKTLVVVVSDHGVRSAPSDPENYRVPLLVVGETVEGGEDREFRNHLDLQGLVAHFLMSTPLPPAATRLTLVGSTETWVYGELEAAGGYLFIDDATGKVLSRRGALAPAEVQRRFQAQVDWMNKVNAAP